MGPGGSQRCLVNHQKGPFIEESVGNKKETSRPSPRKAAALNWEDASSRMVLPRVPRQRLFGCYRYRMHILGMHLKASPKSNANQIWPSSHTQTHPHTHTPRRHRRQCKHQDTSDNMRARNITDCTCMSA